MRAAVNEMGSNQAADMQKCRAGRAIRRTHVLHLSGSETTRNLNQVVTQEQTRLFPGRLRAACYRLQARFGIELGKGSVLVDREAFQ